jgi:hypothetical protein
MGKPNVTRLDWGAGCGTFGVLTRPDGAQSLIETVWFSEREVAVVRLANGERQIIPWAQERAMLRVLSAEAACEQVGMPIPPRIKVAGEWRRADPFHTERHRSDRFRSLVALIRARRLPCRYSLLAASNDEQIGYFSGPCTEDPEQTAANVAERLARDQALTVTAALETELLQDALIAVCDLPSAHALLARAGWPAILADLDRELLAFTEQPPALLIAPPTPGAPVQLDLFADIDEPRS